MVSRIATSNNYCFLDYTTTLKNYLGMISTENNRVSSHTSDFALNIKITEAPMYNTLLSEELQGLFIGLQKSNKLLLKERTDTLECQFVKGGLVCHLVEVKSKLVVKALQKAALLGILEGTAFGAFKNTFGRFALHVKALALYHELSARSEPYNPEGRDLLVA